jgi:ethanolamine ammonia-lyase small subunit
MPPADLCIVLADGLSATAINTHAVPVLSQLMPELTALGWLLTPLVLVQQGRVAIADEVAHALKADITLLLIGERPGLTSPHSMGAYLTYVDASNRSRPALTDADRNCVSNIRPEGMPYAFAVQKLLYLLTEMKTRKLSGVQLKDEMGLLEGEAPAE